MDQYASIRQLMAKGNYKAALDVLDEQSITRTVSELTRQCRYHLGCEALLNGDLTNAQSYLDIIKRTKYKDSVTLLEIIDLLK